MHRILISSILFFGFANARYTYCAPEYAVGEAGGDGACPRGFTATSQGWCCHSDFILSSDSTYCAPENLAGPAADGRFCPSGFTATSDGLCCHSGSIMPVNCADKTNANGVNECPGMKSYCNNSVYKTLMTQQCPKTCGFCPGSQPSTCVDVSNPNTGRSDCPANAGLCNNNVYRDLMKKQCPKTCGYCR